MGVCLYGVNKIMLGSPCFNFFFNLFMVWGLYYYFMCWEGEGVLLNRNIVQIFRPGLMSKTL